MEKKEQEKSPLNSDVIWSSLKIWCVLGKKLIQSVMSCKNILETWPRDKKIPNDIKKLENLFFQWFVGLLMRWLWKELMDREIWKFMFN